jgi:hypothetical protein
VNDGIFVKIPRPREIPESSDSVLAYLVLDRICRARRIEVRINGNISESKTTLLVNHVEGITANSSEENNATVGLNLLSAILYTKKVSITEIAPIINRGTANAVSMDNDSEPVFTIFGKLIILNILARRICPKNG